MQPQELVAVEGGFGPVGVALFLVGCAEVGYVSGVGYRKAAEQLVQLVSSDEKDDKSLPVAPAT
jgi:lactobin A/cerein 7B family class IIb bacteriocin